jgi:hypothetical protein
MKMNPLIFLSTLILMSASSLSYADSKISDKETGCKIWNSKPLVGYSISWTGQCKNGKADGHRQSAMVL